MQETAPAAADVKSVDAILAALYDVISGPAGQERDWARFQSLFHPDMGRLLPIRPRKEDGAWSVKPMTPAEYAADAQPIFASTAFFETEVNRIVERFGHLAHVFSTYESRHAPDEKEPFQRGINSIQLLWDEERWWIVSVFWDAEEAGRKIPKNYLP
jgi:hypothetical protein